MIPFYVLLLGTVLARVAGWAGVAALDGWQPAVRVGLALMLVLTGLAHFGGRRKELIAMVPPRLPRPDLLVTVTGVLELAGAVGLLVPGTARTAAVCLALLMLAMFPSNVYAARAGLTLGGKPVTPIGVRIVLQLGFVGAAIAAA